MAIEDNLYSGETVLKTFHPSPWNYWVWYVFALLCIFPGFIFLLIPPFVGVAAVIWKELERRATTYMITDKRVMKEVGILGKHTGSTIYKKITDVRGSQSAIQRMLGIGDIYINTAGGEGPELVLRGIGGMPVIKKEIEQAWSGSG